MAAKLRPLAQQVIVLTGASSGIGLCTAQLAAQQGARLVLIAGSTRLLDTLASLIGATGGQAICIAADVAVRDQLEAAARDAVARLGRIDTWVNSAGVSICGRLDQVSEADSRRLFDVNFWGAVNGSLVAMPYLLGGGALINVGSEVPDADLPLQGMYMSSKHAVKSFTDALRAEVDADRAPVSVTLVQPGGDGTPYARGEQAPRHFEAGTAANGMDPMWVARAILMAATQDAREAGGPHWGGRRLALRHERPDAGAMTRSAPGRTR